MDHANPPIPIRDPRIARAEPNCLLLGRNCLVYRSSEELAEAQGSYCSYPVAIERDCNFKFGNGRLELVMTTQDLSLREMCKRVLRRRGQRFFDQLLCALDVGRDCVGHLVKHAASEQLRQQTLCIS